MYQNNWTNDSIKIKFNLKLFRLRITVKSKLSCFTDIPVINGTAENNGKCTQMNLILAKCIRQAFTAAVLAVWSTEQSARWICEGVTGMKRQLKTHYFRQHLPIVTYPSS